MTLALVTRLAVFCFLLFSSLNAASINDDKETCKAAAEQAGVDFENLKYNVGHVIHSLTVEDVRFFFDENFPIKNDIPTVNTNLTSGPSVLPHTPSFPSKFNFPLGSSLDRILLKNDNPDAFSAKGLTTLEELGHAAHMLEMLHSASKMYKTLENIDIDRVCPCLVDEKSNGIMEELEYLAEVMGKSVEELGKRVVYDETCISSKENQVTSRRGRQTETRFRYKPEGYTVTIDSDGTCTITFDKPSCGSKEKEIKTAGQAKIFDRQQRAFSACPNVPEVTDSYSWNVFKHDVAGPLHDDATQMAKNAAMYLYCKISMLL